MMNKSFKINIPISKVDEEQRTVTGIATTESFDSQGDIVDYEASKSAFNEWLGNIREMHSPVAVGKAIDIQYDDEAKTVQVTAKLSESADGENAWVKVKEGVLAGFSIGGRVLEVVKETVKSGNTEQSANRIKNYVLSELSLVDNPANPDAMFSMVKSVDGNLLRVEQEIDKNTINKPDVWWIEKFMSKKEVKKSVYDAATAIDLASQLAWLIMSESWEDEQDQEQLTLLQTAFQALKDFTAKEVEENDDYLGDFTEVIELARKAVDLRKEAIMAKDIEKKGIAVVDGDPRDEKAATVAEVTASVPVKGGTIVPKKVYAKDGVTTTSKTNVVGGVERDEDATTVADETPDGSDAVIPAEEVPAEIPVTDTAVEEDTEIPEEAVPAEEVAEETGTDKAATIADLAKSMETLLSKLEKSNDGDALEKVSDSLTKFSDKVEKSITSLEGRMKALEDQPQPTKAKSSYAVIGKGDDSEVVDVKADLEKRQVAFMADPQHAPAGEAEAIAKGFRELNKVKDN